MVACVPRTCRTMVYRPTPPRRTRCAVRTWRGCGVAQRAAHSSPRRRPSLTPPKARPIGGEGLGTPSCSLHLNAVARGPRAYPTSHHGLAPKERGLPPVQCPFIARRPITISAARRARAATSRVSPPPETHPAQWCSHVGHAKAGCALEGTARTSHDGPASKEREAFRRCSTLLWCVGRSQPARHGARARQVCVFCHLPKDSQRSGACARATRMPAARWRPKLARRTTALRRKREAFRR